MWSVRVVDARQAEVEFIANLSKSGVVRIVHSDRSCSS